MGIRYSEKAAGKFGLLSCRKMAMGGICSISSVRTVGSGGKKVKQLNKSKDRTHRVLKKNILCCKTVEESGK